MGQIILKSIGLTFGRAAHPQIPLTSAGVGGSQYFGQYMCSTGLNIARKFRMCGNS